MKKYFSKPIQYLIQFSFWGISIIFLCSFTDDPILKKIADQLKKQNEQNPQEKIYLHFDKPYYIQGDTIWIKAYVVDAKTHLPLKEPTIINIDFFDATGKFSFQDKVKSENGIASSWIALDSTVQRGSYMVKSYTQRMKDYSPDFCYKKSLQIFDLTDTSAQQQESSKSTPDLQFFPEGGNLIYGLKSIVGFKAINSNGIGITATGDIKNQSGDIISSFKSQHLGMGKFSFLPKKDEAYIAEGEFSNGEKFSLPLPLPLNEGFVMTINNANPQKILMNIEYSESSSNAQVYLIGQMRGEIVYSESIMLSPNKASVEILKNFKDSGIIQLTLFDSKALPLCERLIFIESNRKNNLRIVSDKINYSPRELVTIDISNTDENGKPVQGEFSLSVTDSSMSTPLMSYDDNIVSNLLLTSDLKGNIEQPAYYFKNNDSISVNALDCLMLTQGWRRFSWIDIMNNNFSKPNLTKSPNISLSGQLTFLGTKPKIYSTLLLSEVGNPGFMSSAYTDFNQNFTFKNLDINERRKFLLQAKNDESTFEDIKINLNEIKTRTIEKTTMNAGSYLYNPYLSNLQNARRIHLNYYNSNSLLETKKNITKNKLEDLISFNDKERIDLTNYIELPTLYEVFKEIVPGIIIKKKKERYSIRLLDEGIYKEEPIYLLNGLPYLNNEIIMNLAPSDVSTIEIIRQNQVNKKIRPIGSSGILAVTTKNKNYIPENLPASMEIELLGFKESRDFYSPKYEVQRNDNKSNPDFRSLVYWNPRVVTDANGKAKVNFYNSDNITEINISIEGITAEGIPGYGHSTYSVSKK